MRFRTVLAGLSVADLCRLEHPTDLTDPKLGVPASASSVCRPAATCTSSSTSSSPASSELSDEDFLKTLASLKCVLIPPNVVRVHKDGSYENVAALTFDEGGRLEKAHILLAVISYLARAERMPRLLNIGLGDPAA